MPHVELSLTDAQAPAPRTPSRTGPTLELWAGAATSADEPCLVLDVEAVIVAASVSGASLLGLGQPDDARGRRLREAAFPLVDFTATPAELNEAEAHMIPPLLAISSGRMARGLIRVACPDTGRISTLDVIATPLVDGPDTVGSLTFLTPV